MSLERLPEISNLVWHRSANFVIQILMRVFRNQNNNSFQGSHRRAEVGLTNRNVGAPHNSSLFALDCAGYTIHGTTLDAWYFVLAIIPATGC
jgi:hypothetical protein